MLTTFILLVVFIFILFIITTNNSETNVQYDNNNQSKTLRKGAFYNHANKYAHKIAPPWLIDDLLPYANMVVEKMLNLSKEFKKEGIEFKLADEMDLIECSIELCLKNISIDGYYNYIGNAKSPRIVNAPVNVRCIAEKLVYDLFM